MKHIACSELTDAMSSIAVGKSINADLSGLVLHFSSIINTPFSRKQKLYDSQQQLFSSITKDRFAFSIKYHIATYFSSQIAWQNC